MLSQVTIVYLRSCHAGGYCHGCHYFPVEPVDSKKATQTTEIHSENEREASSTDK